jgi:hypothetical protein
MMQHVKMEMDAQFTHNNLSQQIDWNKLTDQLGKKGLADLGKLLQPISKQLEYLKSKTPGATP